MEKLGFLYTKGIIIGLLTGIVLVLKAIAEGNFNWSKTVVTVPATTIIGYATYEVAASTNVDNVAIMIFTIVISLNGFFVIELLTDKELMSSLFDKYVRHPVLGDKESNDKEDKINKNPNDKEDKNE